MDLEVEWAPCNFCGSEDWETLFTSHDRRYGIKGEFGVTRCRQCGHLQTNPRPTREIIGIFYPDTYASHLPSCRRVKHTERDLLLLEWSELAGFIGRLFRLLAERRFQRLVPRKLSQLEGAMLEIGCGTGWLCALAQKFGWQAVGIDISLSACQHARQIWGMTFICSQDSTLPFKSNSFRLVVLRHVLEHLYSPQSALAEAYRVLQKGGWIALEVPNAGSLGRQVYGAFWDSWDLPRHLHHFTPDTLKRFLERAGFQKVRVISAYHKPFILTSHWLPRKHTLARAVRLIFGIPSWLLLPLLIYRQQGEVLRAWGQKGD